MKRKFPRWLPGMLSTVKLRMPAFRLLRKLDCFHTLDPV